jgi:hypothetical protein
MAAVSDTTTIEQKADDLRELFVEAAGLGKTAPESEPTSADEALV